MPSEQQEQPRLQPGAKPPGEQGQEVAVEERPRDGDQPVVGLYMTAAGGQLLLGEVAQEPLAPLGGAIPPPAHEVGGEVPQDEGDQKEEHDQDRAHGVPQRI